MSKEFTALIESYQRSKVRRIAAIYSDTEPHTRHLLGTNAKKYYTQIRNHEQQN